jgi:hypothetical protein
MQDEPKEINLEAELFDHGANFLTGANLLQKALATNNRFRYCVVFLFSAPKLFLNLCCYFFLPSCSCTVDLQHHLVSTFICKWQWLFSEHGQLWVDINKTNHTLKYSQVSPEQEAVGLYHNQ